MIDAETVPAEQAGSRLLARLRGSVTALGAVAASPGLRRVQLALVGSEIGSWVGWWRSASSRFGTGV
jgi:hypothetical protein